MTTTKTPARFCYEARPILDRDGLVGALVRAVTDLGHIPLDHLIAEPIIVRT